MSSPTPPRVLLVNDDGPCSSSSPHVLGFWMALQDLGWKVDVCLPSAQKSWSGMATTIHSKIGMWYYYPKKDNHDGKHEKDSDSWSSTRREIRDDELGEWVLLDASPSTCTNIGLFSSVFAGQSKPSPSSPDTTQSHSQPQPPAYDLVVSGPNYGRNTGTAFALSSGTLAAAMAGSLAGVKSISVSYGHFQKLPKEIIEAESRLPSSGTTSTSTSTSTLSSTSKERTTSSIQTSGHLPASNEATTSLSMKANLISAKLVEKLYREWEEEVDCYAINVPLCRTLEQPEIIYTRMWDSKYGRLFRPSSSRPTTPGSDVTKPTTYSHQPFTAPLPLQTFQFGPDMAHLLAPKDLQRDTDVWALMNGYISITRLGASFEKRGKDLGDGRREGEKWKL